MRKRNAQEKCNYENGGTKEPYSTHNDRSFRECCKILSL